MYVDFDHAGVRSHFERRDAWIEGRGVALNRDRHPQVGRGVFDGGDQVEIISQEFERRHEDIELALAHLDAQSRARDPRGGFALLGNFLVLGRAKLFRRRKVGGLSEEVGFAFRPFRKFVAGLEWVRIEGILDVLGLCPGERFKRQAVTQGRIARHQEKLWRCRKPGLAGPARRAGSGGYAAQGERRSLRRCPDPVRRFGPGGCARWDLRFWSRAASTFTGRRRSRQR